MKAQYLGHVVFYVKDLDQSLGFYRDLLGFKEVGRIFNGAAAALTSGRTHHELLLIQVGDAPGPPLRASQMQPRPAHRVDRSDETGRETPQTPARAAPGTAGPWDGTPGDYGTSNANIEYASG